MMCKCLTVREKIDMKDMFELGKTYVRDHSMKLANRRFDKATHKYSF